MCLLRGTDWVFICNSTLCPHSVFMCFVWIWEQTAIISVYNVKWLVCITETECVYCAVRTELWQGSARFLMCAWYKPLRLSGHYTVCTTSLTFTILRSAHTVYLCVLCGSENKQRLFPYTTLTDWFYNRDGVCLQRGTDWALTGISAVFNVSVIKTLRPSGHYTGCHRRNRPNSGECSLC